MNLLIIQSLEDELINNPECKTNSVIFTEMMYASSKWIDSTKPKGKIHISPYKFELDKHIEMVVYHIESGETTDSAMALCELNRFTIYDKLSDTHRLMLHKARNQRTINKNKNK